MRHSIRNRLILTLTALLLCMIMTFWFVNRFFLTSYYEMRKVSLMEGVFGEVDELYRQAAKEAEQEEMSADFANALEGVVVDSGVSLSIFGFIDLYGQIILPNFVFTTSNDRQQERTRERIIEIVDSANQGSMNPFGDLIKEGERYYIYKMYDEKMDAEYLECIGELQNENWLYLRTDYQSMRESAVITNQFVGYIGLIITLCGIVLMFFIGRSFTKPIMRLSDIAKRIAGLDFDAKYEEHRDDEIGALGDSMNILSEKLERRN